MKFLKIKLLVIALIMFAASSAFASFSQTFTFDTSSIEGTAGYLDFQFNPGNNTTSNATAVISGFDGANGALGIYDPSQSFGNVSGVLPGQVSITSTPDSQLNDYFHQFTFGKQISFALGIDNYTGSTFALTFYGSDGATSLMTSNPNGQVLTVTMNTNGTTNVNATPTPIPAAAWLLGSGLMGLFGIRRRTGK